MSEISDRTNEAVQEIRAGTGATPSVGIILGSGLGALASEVKDKKSIPYSDIPHFPLPTVKGHVGNLVTGSIGGVDVAVMQGRLHHYEGYYMRDVTFPVRVLAGLGAKVLLVTNAAGATSGEFGAGSFMVISDHINLMGVNPLLGIEADDEGRERFVAMTGAYDRPLLELAVNVSRDMGIVLRRGVLAAVSGPSYETPAEIRMLISMGVDAVCMSTVPEVIMARYLGLKVLGISLITNQAAGIQGKGPSHSEVLDVAGRSGDDFVRLVAGIIEKAGMTGVL